MSQNWALNRVTPSVMYTCTHTHTHTHTHTRMHTDQETNTQQTKKQTDLQTHTIEHTIAHTHSTHSHIHTAHTHTYTQHTLSHTHTHTLYVHTAMQSCKLWHKCTTKLNLFSYHYYSQRRLSNTRYAMYPGSVNYTIRGSYTYYLVLRRKKNTMGPVG